MGKWRQRNHKIHPQLWMEYELGTPYGVPEPMCLSKEPVTAATVRRDRGPVAEWLLWYSMQEGWPHLGMMYCYLISVHVDITYPAQAISSSHMMDGFLGFCGCIILERKSAKSLGMSFRGFKRKPTYHVFQVISWKHREKLCLLRYPVFFFFLKSEWDPVLQKYCLRKLRSHLLYML